MIADMRGLLFISLPRGCYEPAWIQPTAVVARYSTTGFAGLSRALALFYALKLLPGTRSLRGGADVHIA